MDALIAATLQISVFVTSAKRTKGKSAAVDCFSVQFANKKDKLAVLRAKGKLAGMPIGMADFLTQLQQRKHAAWPAIQGGQSQGRKRSSALKSCS